MRVKALVKSLSLIMAGTSLSFGALAGTPLVPVGFIDQAGVEQRQVPVTFGQVFVPGDVVDGSRLVIQLGDTELPTQVDVKARHPDGSVRHAILSTELPVVPADSEVSAEIALADSAQPTGAGITAEALLASGFDAEIRIVLDGVEYVASARTALQQGGAKIWLDGPIATEFLLKAPFVAADGSTHPHLMGRFDLRAYAGLKSVRVDAIVENNWTYVPDPSNFTYDVRILVGGQLAYERAALTHYHHARWHKVFWWGTEPKVVVRHDTRYLQKTRAIPHYDPTLTVSQRALDDVLSKRYEPMSNVWINPYMPAPGADRGIAPLPWWQALHVVSGGDPRAFQAVLDNADAAGSYSAHLRDVNTDLPVSLDDYPLVTGDPYQYPRGGIIPKCSGDCSTPYTKDTAHQPSLAYYPYLITGDHYYLDELIFWANGNLIANSLRKREFEKGLFWNQQVRAQGWTLRTLAQAAYILPDDHPFKGYFLEKLANNARFYQDAYLNGGYFNSAMNDGKGYLVDLANPLHVLVPGKLEDGRPWMDDFFTFAAAYAVELGFSDWKPILEWKAEFPLARMGSADDEYCWIFGAVYAARFGTGNGFTTTAQWIPSFRAYYLENWGNRLNASGKAVKDMACGGQEMADFLSELDGNNRYRPGEMYGYARSPMGYPANLQPALAYLVDAGLPRADIAWDRFYNRDPFPDYSYDPQFAITPRSLNPQYAVPTIVDFSVSATTVESGQTVQLSWSVVDADSCEASGDWQGPVAMSGNFTTVPLDRDAVFTLRCRNGNGVSARSLLVAVNGAQGSNESQTPPADPAPEETVGEGDTSVVDGGALGDTAGNEEQLPPLNTDPNATDAEVVVVSVGAVAPLGLMVVGLVALGARRRKN